MTIRAGTHLGPYEILAPLGAGGMGEVYRAMDSRLARSVAIKVLPEEFFEDRDRVARFGKEAKTLAALNHRGIAAIYSFEEISGRHLLVMELIDGEDLGQRLVSGPLTLDESLGYAREIADALEAAHEKGIVHRDLKPANVKVTPDGRVKLLDFGLAKIFEGDGAAGSGPAVTQSPTLTARATAAGVILGTAAYMSPEQARGKPIDKRTDIWAFGCVLYEMLTGKRAFEGDTVSDTLAAVLTKEPDWAALPERTPAKIRDLLGKCLRREAKRRLHDIADARLDLEEPAATTPGSTGQLPFEERTASPYPAGASAERTSRRRGSKTFLYLSWAIAIAAAAVAGWAVRVRRTPLPDFTRLTYRLGNVVSARFSPDGGTVVYSASWDRRPPTVFAVGADGGNPRALWTSGAIVCSVSSRGDVAVLLGDKEWRTRPGLARTLAVLPLSGGAPREVLEKVRFADWGPDGSELAVVHRVGDKDVLEYPIGTKLYESAAWLFSLRVSPGGDQVAVYESTAESCRLLAIDRKGRQQVFAREGRPGVPGLAWSPDGKEIWLSHLLGSDPIRKTWAFDSRGGKRLLFRDPSLTYLFDVSRDGRALFQRDIHRFQARAKGPGEESERDVSWRDGTRVVDMSRDGRTIVFGEGELTRPSFDGNETWIASLDGGLPKKLADVSPGHLSADGSWVFGVTNSEPARAVLVPTGAGQPRVLETPGLSAILAAGVVLPGGKQVLTAAREPGRPPKTYVLDVETGRHRFLTAGEGVASADGTRFAFREAESLAVLPVAGGEPHIAALLQSDEIPLRFSLDGKSIYLRRDSPSGLDVDVDRVELDSGRRTPWKHFSISGFAGAVRFSNIAIAPEADAYAYSYAVQQASDLFVVTGLR